MSSVLQRLAWIRIPIKLSMFTKSSVSMFRLKINCVVMRGVNADELPQFLDLAREQEVDVRFIEWMPFDDNGWKDTKFVSYQVGQSSNRWADDESCDGVHKAVWTTSSGCHKAHTELSGHTNMKPRSDFGISEGSECNSVIACHHPVGSCGMDRICLVFSHCSY